MGYILECRDLYKNFGGASAINNLNIRLSNGKIIGLLGPNGSGKTTLIKMIVGLIRPTAGQILIDGMWPNKDTKALVSYLPDSGFLPGNMKISECLEMFEDFFSDFDVNIGKQMLSSLNLNLDTKVKFLSKGNIEKVNLIMAMSRRAKLYLLDEPIAGVDPAARDYIISTIINNYNSEASVIISTHLIADIENVLDEVIFLRNGQVVLYNSVDALRTQEGKSTDAIFREVFSCF